MNQKTAVQRALGTLVLVALRWPPLIRLCIGCMQNAAATRFTVNQKKNVRQFGDATPSGMIRAIEMRLLGRPNHDCRRCAHKIYWDFAFEFVHRWPTGRQAVTYITCAPETESSRRPFQAYQKCPICARLFRLCARRTACRTCTRTKKSISEKQSKIDGGPHALTSIQAKQQPFGRHRDIFM